MTAAHDDDFMALPGMEAGNAAPSAKASRSSGDAADSGPASSKSALDAPVHYARKADIDSCLSASGMEPSARRIVVDTPGAPWGNSYMEVSHSYLHDRSPRPNVAEGVPTNTPTKTHSCRSNDTRTPHARLAPSRPIHTPNNAVRRITISRSHNVQSKELDQ